MVRLFLCALLTFGSIAVVDVPQSGAGPLRNLIARGVARRQARRAEGRGFLPGIRIRHRMSHGSHASCGVTSRALSSCPNCPSTSGVPAAPSDCPDCPNGVCPKTK